MGRDIGSCFKAGRVQGRWRLTTPRGRNFAGSVKYTRETSCHIEEKGKEPRWRKGGTQDMKRRDRET